MGGKGQDEPSERNRRRAFGKLLEGCIKLPACASRRCGPYYSGTKAAHPWSSYVPPEGGLRTPAADHLNALSLLLAGVIPHARKVCLTEACHHVQRLADENFATAVANGAAVGRHLGLQASGRSRLDHQPGRHPAENRLAVPGRLTAGLRGAGSPPNTSSPPAFWFAPVAPVGESTRARLPTPAR